MVVVASLPTPCSCCARSPPTPAAAPIERQSPRLVRLVDDLLDVARINHGVITLKLERVELYEVARQTAEASRTRMEERHPELSLSLPERTMIVDGDPVRLEQVITNLLDNCVECPIV